MKYVCPSHDGFPFDGVSLEYTFSQYRTYLELITIRDKDDRFSGIEFSTLKQETHVGENGKRYDKLLLKISALRDADFEELKDTWYKNIDNEQFDRDAHMRRDNELRIVFEAEYWFEISSLFK